ncbi:MAG: hypothetical protein ACK4VI_06685 [Alphaproteobacteria bacterium]
MFLRIQNFVKTMQSQGYPGFAIKGSSLKVQRIKGSRHQALPLSLICIGALFSLAGFLIDGDGLEISRAEATVAAVGLPEAGRNFTASQRRNLQRAIAFNPDNIEKMHGETIRAALQEPELVRADLPTVVWQYRTENCVLDVYFRTQTADVTLAPVVHYEVRSRSFEESAATPDERKCLKSLMSPSGMPPRMLSVSMIYKSLM